MAFYIFYEYCQNGSSNVTTISKYFKELKKLKISTDQFSKCKVIGSKKITDMKWFVTNLIFKFKVVQ